MPLRRQTLTSNKSRTTCCEDSRAPARNGLRLDFGLLNPRGTRHTRRMTSAPPEGRLSGLEVRSIDYVPLDERHGKLWHLGPLWFMSNAQIATLAVGVISITEGGTFWWSI